MTETPILEVLSPNSPSGRSHNITLTGHLINEVTEGAWAEVVIKVGLIKLMHKKFDICDVLRERESSVQCPIQPGDLEIKDTFALPREIPPVSESYSTLEHCGRSIPRY